MKTFRALTITFIVVLLVSDSRCGVIDGVIGTVKDTTHGLTQDVKNVWSYSTSFVFGSDQKPEEQEQGLIGGWIHTAKEKVHSIHDYVWGDHIPSDRGFISSMYNRVKNRLSKLKRLILRKGETVAISNTTQSEDAKIVKETLDKLFFGNGTRKVQGQAFNEAISNLRRRLVDLRQNLTDSVSRGPGDINEAINVRGASDVVQENIDVVNNIKNIDVNDPNTIYDNVEVAANKVNKVKKRIDKEYREYRQQ